MNESKLFELLFRHNWIIFITTSFLFTSLTSCTAVEYAESNANKLLSHNQMLEPIRNYFKRPTVEYNISKTPAYKKVCKTPGCIKAASLVLKKIDTTIDPCDNFYRFTCGKYLRETVISKDKSYVSVFNQNNYRLQKKLKKSIEQKIQRSDPRTLKLLHSYYTTCLGSAKKEIASTKEVVNIIKSLGGWPVLVGESWNGLAFDWQELIYRLRKIGLTKSMNSFVGFNIEVDQKNNSRYVITLDQAATGLAQEYLSKGLKEKVVRDYYKYMIHLAELLGADSKQANKELAKSLDFEIGLSRISLATGPRRNAIQMYNLMTVKQLQSKYPIISWHRYLNKLSSPLFDVKYTDTVNVKVPKFLGSLSTLIIKTPKRTLANYAIWRVLQESVDFMDKRVRSVKTEFKASRTGTSIQKARWVRCIRYLSKKMPLATGALFVRKNFDKHSKRKVEDLVNELRKSFKNILKKVDWMDEETKRAALMKLTLMQSHIAYPNEFLDNEKLDDYFRFLKPDVDSFYVSHLRLNLFNLENKLKLYAKPVNKTNWITHGRTAVVNAFYKPTENSMQIPAGILQGEFYSSKRPNYMNYGGIGFSIGHEITHGFDDHGSQYDKDGNLANWWNRDTKKKYLKRTQCIVDQYSNYTVPELGLNVNGRNTQGENIADNGGIKESYFAYEEYERQNGQEPRLPGLPYSARQMFWISVGNVWCRKYRREALKNRLITDVHSPGEFRVIGPISNMPQFAKDFGCPLGSPMNPRKKCTVW